MTLYGIRELDRAKVEQLYVASTGGGTEVPGVLAEHEAQYVAPGSVVHELELILEVLAAAQGHVNVIRYGNLFLSSQSNKNITSQVDKETDAARNLDWLDHNGHGLLGSGERFQESQEYFETTLTEAWQDLRPEIVLKLSL